MKEDTHIYEEQKKLVLIRLKSLNPEAKLMFGGDKRVSVKTMIEHVEEGDEFGRNIIKAQIKMLRVLTGVE